MATRRGMPQDGRLARLLLAVTAAASFVSLPLAARAQPMSMGTSTLTVAQNGACQTAPATQTMGCMAATYPEDTAATQINAICTSANIGEALPACTLLTACMANTTVTNDTQSACDSFTLLATACEDPALASNSNCAGYVAFCGNGSMVAECSTANSMLNLPTLATINADVQSICTGGSGMMMMGSMTSECAPCMASMNSGAAVADCDLLTVYSSLCVSMPGMSECTSYSSMCSGDPSLYLCNPNSGNGFDVPPAMNMYFTAGQPFYLLFQGWVPSVSTAAYGGAWIAIFCLGILYEGLQVLRMVFDAVLARNEADEWEAYAASVDKNAARLAAIAEDEEAAAGGAKCTGMAADEPCPMRVLASDGEGGAVPVPAPHRRISAMRCYSLGVSDLLRGLLAFVTSGIGYLLMLAVMSFNIGIIFAASGGIGAGVVLFGQFKRASYLASISAANKAQ